MELPESVRVLRGRASTIEVDRVESERLLEFAAAGERAVRVWAPHRQIAFGRRDARLEGYERARNRAREHDFPPVERSVGGRAVAYDGTNALAFVRAEPVADFRRGTDERYERLTNDVEGVLEGLGLEPVRGEPADSFCPGAHSISLTSADGSLRKVVGIAQRVRSDGALVSGIIIVDAAVELAAVLEEVYDALDVPFDPTSVGSVANGGGTADPDRLRKRLEDALVGDGDPVYEEISSA
ncbi:lipoyl protein ligase domain-containing protein [Natronosalvus vescus]|uniref:lipoyl protein ligase domain-containing protein n=1 Tax=Natronosalvus vescus TaxID=2953881 RepID=UPI002090FE39|nr:lipoate--protein ligase family protein [Natronosalvus vescus]